jgi:hypothetical protein
MIYAAALLVWLELSLLVECWMISAWGAEWHERMCQHYWPLDIGEKQ